MTRLQRLLELVRRPVTPMRRWLTCAWALWTQRAGVRWAVGIAMIASMGAGLWGIYREAPRSMTSVSADTQTLTLRAISPTAAAFTLPYALETTNDVCLNRVVVTPRVGTVVSYAQAPGQGLTVTVIGPHSLTADRPRANDDASRRAQRSKSGASQESPAYAVPPADERQFRVGAAATRCAGGSNADRTHFKLPVQGTASFGALMSYVTDANSQPLTMASAKVTVYGRAIAKVFWWSPFSFGPFEANALYQSDTLDLPGGSRIGPDIDLTANVTGSDGQPRWNGYVDVDLSAASLHVEASTSADRIEVYSPEAPDGPLGELPPDIISLRLGARLADDPNMKWLISIFGAIGTTYALLIGVTRRQKE